MSGRHHRNYGWAAQIPRLCDRARVLLDLCAEAYENEAPISQRQGVTPGTVFSYSAEGDRCDGGVVSFECVMRSADFSHQLVEILQFFVFVASGSEDEYVVVLPGSNDIIDFAVEYAYPDTLLSKANVAISADLLRRFSLGHANQAIKAHQGLQSWLHAGSSPFAAGRDIACRKVTVAGHSMGAAVGGILASALADPAISAGALPDVDFYGFAPPPYFLSGATPEEPGRFVGHLFINEADAIPSLRMPNIGAEPQTLHVLPPVTADMTLYHLRDDGSVELPQVYEKYCASWGADFAGIPFYLAFNCYHHPNSYQMALRLARPHFDAAAPSEKPYVLTLAAAAYAAVTRPYVKRSAGLSAPLLAAFCKGLTPPAFFWACTSVLPVGT